VVILKPQGWVGKDEQQTHCCVLLTPVFPVSSAHQVQKSILLAAIQKEIQRHDLSYFVDEPPSVAQGRVPGMQKADSGHY
jgi:hypothetical protein